MTTSARKPDLHVVPPQPTSQLEGALFMVRRGFHLFRVTPGAKTPFRKGINEATTDEPTIRQWAAETPDLNFGVRADCGPVGVIADHDAKFGAHWKEEAFRLYGDTWVPTFAVWTPTGGIHLYFGGEPSGQAPLDSTIDVRSRNGYVLAPGSIVNGKPYRLHCDLPPAPLPDVVRRKLGKRLEAPNSPAETLPPLVELDRADTVQAATRMLQATDGAVEGKRNKQLYALAVELMHRGASQEKAAELLEEIWIPKCVGASEFTDDEIAKTIWSAYRRNDGRAPGCKHPDVEFAPIEGVPAAGSHLLEYPRDVDLAEMIERQSHALVKGVLHPGETAMIYGDSTAGKTFVAIDLGWHSAHGLDWHGRRTKQAPVLYVALEGVEGFRKRMLAATKEHGDPGKWFARLKLHVSLVKSDAGAQGAAKIVEAALLQAQETGEAPGVIMIDTLARATAGDDENAVSDMMAFVEKRAGEIARRTEAAVVVVHHENKQGGLRGSSSLRGAFDAVLRVERHSTDADASRRVVAEKVKDDSEGALFDFKLRVVELGRDNDDLPVTSCVLETSAPTAKAAPVKETEGQKALREALKAAVAAGKGMPYPNGRDAPAAPETAVREHFKSTYKNGEPSEGAIRNAWSKALKDLPVDIQTKDVDGVTCFYVWTPPEQPKNPRWGSDADDEFAPVVDPDEGLEPTEK